MKQLNLNAVRTSSQPEWRAAFMDRLIAMVERDKNHPSAFIWDTGNEAGLGSAHFAMADWLVANEPTRPKYHQPNNPDGDAPYADVWGRAEGEDWRRVRLDRLETTVTDVTVTPVESGVQVAVTSRVAAPDVTNAWFDQTMTYTIDGSGTIHLGHKVTPQGDVRTLTYLPRIGVSLAVPSSYGQFAWYGRRAESYVDRRECSPIGVYKSSVKDRTRSTTAHRTSATTPTHDGPS